jgi:hypothetical protein
MSSLHIAVGYDGPGNTAAVSLVYLGRSGSACQDAMELSPASRFEVFRSVHGVRKNNPRAAANAQRPAKATPAAEASTRVLAAESASLLAENAELKEDIKALRSQLAAKPRRL